MSLKFKKNGGLSTIHQNANHELKRAKIGHVVQ
jgi:hypothetical protein